jgi:phospholipase/carboxylesterase
MDSRGPSIKSSGCHVSRGPAFRAESGLFSSSAHDTTCAQFAPLHYEPDYSYPLIVWLHGHCDDERQLLRVMPLVSMRNYMAVAPRGTCIRSEERNEERAKGFGYSWGQSHGDTVQAEQRIFDAIDSAVEKFNIAADRVFLAGFDCGGTMAFRIAMNNPDRFAGVLSLCGPFPNGRAPLGNIAKARDLPVFLAVGRNSSHYSPDDACENLRLLHSAGVSVALGQYPCGQELTPQMLADLDRWIIEQICSPETSLK